MKHPLIPAPFHEAVMPSRRTLKPSNLEIPRTIPAVARKQRDLGLTQTTIEAFVKKIFQAHKKTFNPAGTGNILDSYSPSDQVPPVRAIKQAAKQQQEHR